MPSMSNRGTSIVNLGTSVVGVVATMGRASRTMYDPRGRSVGFVATIWGQRDDTRRLCMLRRCASHGSAADAGLV
jgi:hypothetical protein